MQVDTATIIRLLSGKTLAEADRLLDEARRIVWTVQFIGGTWEQAGSEANPAARTIAECFEGVPLTTANTALEDVRFACWVCQCEGMEQSRFARQVVDRWAGEAPPPGGLN